MSRALLLLLCSGCALPVVSAGTFLPAGDLEPGQFHASASLEAGRVLAGPADVRDLPATPPDAQQYDVSTWVASDASLRYQASKVIAVEGQLKLTDPVVPFTPALVGGAVGMRVRLQERPAAGGVALEVGFRAVGVSVQQRIERSASGRTQTDTWDYRALGVEVPLVATYRVNALFAVTASPFVRAYWIRAFHTITLFQPPQTEPITRSQAALQWSPVLSGGLGTAAAFDLGPVELSPGIAVELVTKPGPSAVTHFIFEPGISVGARF
ncbi:MAG TPA: hypothetical protein VFP52_14465 [Myxococcales bacterium]|nr:hypothetical protein [Myxococcales bacterium]